MSDTFKTAPESGQNSKLFLDGNNTLAHIKTALAVLLMNIGVATTQGQTTQTTTGKNSIEMVTDTKAKADIDALMKKYSLTNLDDLSNKSPNEILEIRNDLMIILGANQSGQYHLDPTLVKFRDEVRMYVDVYASPSYDRSIYTTVVGRGEKLAKTDEKLAKTDEKLAKTDEKLAKSKQDLAKSKQDLAKSKQELEEIKNIAKQFGIPSKK